MKRFFAIAMCGWLSAASAFSAICYVSTTGNDSTAARGNPALPSLTLTNAAALSQSGDVILMGSGTFPLGVNHIDLDNRRMAGSGRSATFVTGGGGVLIWVKGTTALSDFTLTSTNLTGALSFPVDTLLTNSPSASITLSNLSVYGQSDGISIVGTNAISFYATNCLFNTTYDAVILISTNAASAFALSGCTVLVTNNPAIFGPIKRGVTINGGPVVGLTNVAISVISGSVETKGIQNINGNLTLQCATVTATSASGTVYRLEQLAGATSVNSNFGTSQVQITGGTLTQTAPCNRTFYVDYTGGSDANSGAITGAAWKLCPGMNGFAGSYTHAAGDRFIFRGGTTWPRTAFQLNIVAGGSSESARDYYGVDTNWFSGASWTRPTFDFENVQIGSGFSSSAGVLLQNAPFITFDGIDIKRHRSPVSFGASSVSLFGTTSSVTFTNCVVRDWSVAGTGAGSDAGGGIQNYSSGANFLVVSCLLHQDNEANKCGYATKGINVVAYSEVRNTPNAVFAYASGHHNHVHHIPNCTDPTSHPNAMATTGPATTYANLIHDLAGGVSAIFVSPDWSGGASVDLVYNNVVYNVGLQAPIQLDTGGANTSSIGLRAYNNVLVANGGGYCIRVVERGTGPYGTLDVRNCQLIGTGTPLGYNNPGIGNGNVTTVTLLNNLTQTPAVANAAGYTSGNNYAPTAISSPTVRTGTDLSSVFNVDRLGTIRPAGLWDIAAYQFAAGGITNPPPPTPLAPNTPVAVSPSNGEMNVSLRPVLTASAFSDPQGSAQIASQFLILQSGSVVADSGIYVAGVSYPVPDPLANFTAYQWQARYQNAFGLWSPYSGLSGFTTTNVVITPPPPPSTNPPPNPPPPSGVRLRVSNVHAGKVRAK